jgi:RNA-directed DNA polymerase
MKRYGDLYSKITDISNIRLAYIKARKGKRWQSTVKKFEANLEENLLKIQKMLVDKTYVTSKYVSKTIYEPKERLIYKLPFAPDRIVQHAIMTVVEPIWESFFISDSYACRKNKGIHAGSRRTMGFVRRNKYCLKCDISKFYPTMNHDVLYKIICRKIKDKDVLSLMKEIIESIGGDTNVPIGNYTSQWMGNLYLNEIDQRVKHVYKIKDYVRYCDDFLLFSNDKVLLKNILEDMEGYINHELKLKLSKKDIFQVSRGIDFLGYRHFRKYILLRKSTAKRVRKRLKILPYLLNKGVVTKDQYRSSLASTSGWLKWANSYNLRNKLCIGSLLKEVGVCL